MIQNKKIGKVSAQNLSNFTPCIIELIDIDTILKEIFLSFYSLTSISLQYCIKIKWVKFAKNIDRIIDFEILIHASESRIKEIKRGKWSKDVCKYVFSIAEEWCNSDYYEGVDYCILKYLNSNIFVIIEQFVIFHKYTLTCNLFNYNFYRYIGKCFCG